MQAFFLRPDAIDKTARKQQLSIMTVFETLIRKIHNANHIVAFTGAGISTESGIPDFRSPGGVWTKMQPIMFDDFVASREMRDEAWSRIFDNKSKLTGAKPNTGHMALARLCELGKLDKIITQNVDGLHQLSGLDSRDVIEIHGNATYAACLDCKKRFEIADLEPLYRQGNDIRCSSCNGIIKRATISFGQAMPEDKMFDAVEAATRCDLMIVMGSSLVVYPAAEIPRMASEAGATLAIINRDATPLDDIADIVINAEIGQFGQRLITSLGN